jgi:hypothetical protein
VDVLFESVEKCRHSHFGDVAVGNVDFSEPFVVACDPIRKGLHSFVFNGIARYVDGG